MKIWKYVLNRNGMTELEVPEGAEFATAGILNGEVCVWAVVDPTKPKTKRNINIVWTGHEADNVLKYVEMFIVGPIVYHVVEVE